jgi:hypothetical protein
MKGWLRALIVAAIASFVIGAIVATELADISSRQQATYSHPQQPSDYTRQKQDWTAEVAVGSDWLDAHREWINVISTIFIAGFTGTLWWATARLWQASLIHASHADRAISVSEYTAKRQLRAYIFTVSGNITWDPPRVPHVTIIARNHGLTPAYSVEIYAIFDAVEIGKELIFPPFGSRTITKMGVIAPRAQFKYVCDAEGTIRVAFRREQDVPRTFLAWGEIRYKDAFGDPQWSRYCLGTIDQDGINMEPIEIGNDAS